MTDVNIPVMPGAVAKKPVTLVREKYSKPKTNNQSFYKQFDQIGQKQKRQLENGAICINEKGSKTLRKTDKVNPNNLEEIVNDQIELNFLAEETSSIIGVVEETETILAVGPFNQGTFTTLASLPEQVDGQSTNNPDSISITKVPAESSVKNEPVAFLEQEEKSLLQIVIPVQGLDKPKSLTGDAKAMSSNPQEVQQAAGNTNDLFAAIREQQVSTTPIVLLSNKSDTENGNNVMMVKNQSEQTVEAKTGQLLSTGEKVTKEAPEGKSWIKELLPEQSGKPKVQSPAGAETKQNTDRDSNANSKPGPATDVKKLIDFETHRLNASRLSSESKSIADGQTKTVSDESKAIISALSRGDADLLKITSNVNGLDSSKNLPTAREIMAQVVQKAELMFTNKLSELKIDLKPEFLGRLTIKVTVEEGIVTARFIAENQQVKHMLETNLHTLRQNLESQGIRVERTEVNVQLNNGGMFDGSEGSRQYLWEEGQFFERHQREGPYGDNQYTGGYEELDPTVTQAGEDYGYNENGSLNFLI